MRRLRLTPPAIICLALLALGAPSAYAAPGVPAPAQELFTEDFENAPVADENGPATLITAYTGAAPESMTYTASSPWNGSQPLDCNGLVVRGSMTNNVFAGCFGSVQQDGDLMRASAQALALVEDPGLPGGGTGAAAKANEAVTAATAASTATTGSYAGTQLETTKPLPIAAGRFVNFSVDVAEVACVGSDYTSLRFARLNGANVETPLTATPIVPCPQKPGGRGALIATVPTTTANYDIYGGRFASSGSLLSDGDTVRVRMTNDSPTPPGGNGGAGNDSAIDNLRVIDATPIVDKRFAAPAAGSLSTTLQLYVTNDDDLGAKNGFSLADSLPAGLSVAPAAQPSVSCFAAGNQTATTFPVSASGSQVTVAAGDGKLGPGESHCRIDVEVVAAALGTYTAGANLFSNRIGVDEGTGDSVTFTPAPPALVTPSSVAVAAPRPQCSDGRDNDGDATVDTADPGCSSAADNNEADESVADLVLCGRGKIRLVRADAQGGRVTLSGVVSPSLAGKKVTLTSRLGRKSERLATVTPKADGTFSASVANPPRSQRIRIRYRASVSGANSVALKLPQALATNSVRRAGGQIVVTGKVQRDRLGKRNPVQVRRILCGRTKLVGSAKPSPSGAYTIRFNAPSSGDFAFYRAESSVLARPGSKRYVKQFARGVTIRLGRGTG